MSKESMKLALEALESLQDWPGAFEKCVKAETALREALAEQPAQPQQGPVAVELVGVEEAIKEGDGFWKPCTGCYETNEGYPPTGAFFSAVFKCHMGHGCSECGGIGAIWDDTDYEAMEDLMMRDDAAPQPAQQEPVAWNDEQLQMLNFLYGAGDFDGVWFDQKHPTEKGAFWWRKHLRRLFDTPQAQPAPVQGWKLVPVKPTKEMITAGSDDLRLGGSIGTIVRADECYRAMLAAAPQPAQPAQEHFTKALRYDLSPAMIEGEIRDKLIELGWAPPEQPAQQQEPVTVLPDGSAFVVMSYPLPKDHWLYADRQYNDGEYEPVELGKPVLTHELRDAVVSAVRYAIRSATNCGKEADFDPDALVQNAVYALCGPFTSPPQRKPLTIGQQHDQFQAYVKAELGDIAVMDQGRYISLKIQNYWKIWKAAHGIKEQP